MNRLVLCLVGSVALAPCLLPAADPVDYTTQIKPILARRCYACHAAIQQESGLRVDTAALLKSGGDSGEAIIPGDARGSLLIQMVRGEEGLTRMPMEGEPLGAEEIALLEAWINQGAPAPEEPVPPDPRQHWAFQPPTRPAVPEVAADWVRNPIDAFIAAEHQRRGLEPVGEAPKELWLRRVSLDLVGLPPTREELRAFLADDSPDAWEKVVNRLLESPRYGERWGRHWMDVWRYSDWAGYRKEVRDSQPHIWRWRDWIIESLNADKPYDAMVREMLAGDELAPTDPQILRATGYLVRNFSRYNRNGWMVNSVDHTAKAFLGLTLACARCHDHMYDPIAQTEYYRFRAIFEPHHVRTDRVPGESNVEKDGLVRAFDAKLDEPTYLFVRGDDKSPDKDNPLKPGVPEVLGGTFEVQPVALPPEAHYQGLVEFVQRETIAQAEAAVAQAQTAANTAQQELAQAEIARADATPEEASPEALAEAERLLAEKQARLQLAAKKLAAAQAQQASVQARIAADEAKYATPPHEQAPQRAAEAARAERQAAAAAAEAELLEAEQKLAAAQAAEKPDDNKSKQAREAAEKAVAEARKKHDEARAALEKQDANYTPLTPVHPDRSTGRRLALARWIASPENPLTARVAVNHLWLRHFGAALVPTVFDFGLNGQLPTHPELLDWLAVELVESGWSMKHLHRLMVTSNTYRMHSASTGGEANQAADPDNRYLWRMNVRRMEAEIVRDSVLHVAGQLDLTMGGPELDQNQGETVPRRSIYFRHAHEKQMVFLQLFDNANVNECYRRTESVVPQQALALVNSRLALAQARLLAARLAAESSSEDDPFIAAAFEQVLSRAPTAEEQAACREFLERQAQRLADTTGLTVYQGGQASPVKPSPDPLQRARENLVHVLLNHNDFVTIR